jgi:hypothetical protein
MSMFSTFDRVWQVQLFQGCASRIRVLERYGFELYHHPLTRTFVRIARSRICPC